MEPLGIVLGLAGLYSSVLTVFDRISAARSYTEESGLFVSKVAAERLRLSLWGEAVGLTGGVELHERLRNPLVYGRVQELLAWAVHFVEGSERHGSKHHRVSTERRDRTQLSLENNDRTPIRFSTSRVQKRASIFVKMRWSFSGQKKSEKLLKELQWFIDELEALVPTPTIKSAPEDRDATMDFSDTPRSSLLILSPSTTSRLHLYGSRLNPQLETSYRQRRMSQMRARRSRVNQKIHQRARKESKEVQALARKQAKILKYNFCWYAGLGGSAGTVFFF
ncbi:hypothetical protein K440DRAFT_665087 [Wilcoxina mikolae CBS 423.85]|nr:hypothetical protein K440DRAFT_665087 [Wilcoxina mikolae CBS 423.85]